MSHESHAVIHAPPLARILTLRRQKEMIGTAPTKLYGIPTKAFNQAVKRKQGHLPSDFMFQLTAKEKAAAVTTVTTATDSLSSRLP